MFLIAWPQSKLWPGNQSNYLNSRLQSVGTLKWNGGSGASEWMSPGCFAAANYWFSPTNEILLLLLIAELARALTGHGHDQCLGVQVTP